MKSSKFIFIVLVGVVAVSCLPKEDIVLKDVKNIVVLPGKEGYPILTGDAIFYNPNSSRMKLKEIKVDVLVDGKKSATVDDKLSIVAKGKSEFTVPLKLQLETKEFGLVQTLKNIFGGKKYEIQFVGTLKVNVNGLPVRIPVDHKEEFKFAL